MEGVSCQLAGGGPATPSPLRTFPGPQDVHSLSLSTFLRPALQGGLSLPAPRQRHLCGEWAPAPLFWASDLD